MAPRIENLVNYFGYFPIFLVNILSPKSNGSTFPTLLLTIYHNLIKYLSLGLLILIVMVASPLIDYTSTLIRLSDESNYPIFALIVFNLISNVSSYFIADYSCRSKSSLMKWTEIFQLINQSTKMSTKIDNSPDLVQSLIQFTRKVTISCIIFIIGRSLMVSLIILSIYFRRESTLSLTIYGNNQLIETIFSIIIIVYMITFSSLDHVNSHLFDIMVEYFVQKFRVINDQIATIVKSGKQQLTTINTSNIDTMAINDNQAKSLHETELRSILDQHDTLKVNLKLYDKYWASINVITLLIKPLVCLFCVYQLTFRVQTIETIIFLWLNLFEAIYLFTRMFTSGTNVSDEIDAVAANGLRLILFNYSIPVLQRLQLFNQHIMFTEIGFSCGGLFTFTLDSVLDAFIELTQDFLLTLDFVITVRQARLQLIK
ncbi:uncharacterized protein LOC128395011 [Panonychus citri]|uniref:uncharacterized protein LOC128395011 n=1 Tax=Panonychus citri TaxID=50023 RepID=UPI002308289D|nr:uncharacterized protein LOC128395011 [Panonychus citri]